MSTAKATKSTAMATVSSSSSTEQQASALTLLVLLPILYISYHLIKRASTTTKKTKKKPTTHGLKSHPLLGHIPAFLKNHHRFLDWSMELIVASPDHRMGFWIPGCGRAS